MDGKRVLRWEQDLNGWWKAVTKNGTWYAHDEGHWRLAGGQWSGQVSDGNLSTAQAICESDYIARCSEFLRVAGPGECVVKVDQLIEVVAAACEACNKAGVCPCIHGVPMTCCVCASLTAAIDAAKGE